MAVRLHPAILLLTLTSYFRQEDVQGSNTPAISLLTSYFLPEDVEVRELSAILLLASYFWSQDMAVRDNLTLGGEE